MARVKGRLTILLFGWAQRDSNWGNGVPTGFHGMLEVFDVARSLSSRAKFLLAAAFAAMVVFAFSDPGPMRLLAGAIASTLVGVIVILRGVTFLSDD